MSTHSESHFIICQGSYDWWLWTHPNNRYTSILSALLLLLPRTHAQGIKQSVLSVISTKTTRSLDSGITVVGKCDQIVGSSEKLSSFCFSMLGTCQGRYKSCDYIGHAYQPHLAIPHIDSTAHARAQYRKGSSSHNMHVRPSVSGQTIDYVYVVYNYDL